MKIWSNSFADGSFIPQQYTKDDGGISPPLAWSEVPEQTREFALVVEQANIGTGERRFAYWLLYAIPPDWRELPEGAGNRPDGASAPLRQGVSSLGRRGYAGPYGAAGREIVLRFRLFALSQPLDLPEGEPVAVLLQAMKGKILAEADLTATFIRSHRRDAG